MDLIAGVQEIFAPACTGFSGVNMITRPSSDAARSMP
jgi:hypothetical protein